MEHRVKSTLGPRALPGTAMRLRLCLESLRDALRGQFDVRQSLHGSAFPGRAWERETLALTLPPVAYAWELRLCFASASAFDYVEPHTI